ncbi:protein ITPRID2 isoform X2 [Spea bombifrons]|uniref:protein ITPRID2 isoform X2 n=1 Tax=Spea bombifrons TaxID=233779 RepID=UPI002348FDA0|nr:protein ITPRID2 isoform X2 [Spea bombifrons]
MDEVVTEEDQSRAVATEKRKAWAKSRDSWQASEAEDVSAEASQISQAERGKLQLEGSGNIPNEKIAIWLKDCKTPLGASLDEQNTPAAFLKGMILKNGGSFEDDLSLGAEANHLHQRNLPMEPPCNGLLARDRRLQFHQKGRSMNSTGSGKSSATVSSVSELLDLYEEDPEEILYNLGFGRDEPDIASKIPSRFFSNSSLAHGIDIKVFLNAQVQRMEVENPNYALTSRFRQIKVLTDVANAFSSLYSQVSGTPLQKIGSSKSLSVNEPPKPAPLNRAASQTAVRLMETLSKLNLCGSRGAGEFSPTTPSHDKEQLLNDIQNQDDKIEQKLQKPFKKNSPPLATVKEEASNPLLITDLMPLDISSVEKDEDASNSINILKESHMDQEEISNNQNECDSPSTVDSSSSKDLGVSADLEAEISIDEENPHTSTPDKELYAPSQSLSLVSQPKESFELEESSEEEPPNVSSISRLTLEKIGKDLLRTASQHSDSSGFAEDTSGDCALMNSAQLQESLQAMGSSADSCDSENTVISESPKTTDLLESSDIENDEYLTPRDISACKMFFGERDMDTADLPTEPPQINPPEVIKSSDNEDDSGSRQECSADSEMEISNEYEATPYTTHHISESMDCFSDYDHTKSDLGRASSCSVERVHVALQRAQMKVLSSSEATGTRTGRSMISSKDLLKRRHKYASSGYPLRRTQSLPSALLSPVRVVSKVNIVLTSGKATVCSPPSFSYKYTPNEEEISEQPNEDGNTNSESALLASPKSESKEVFKSGLSRLPEGSQHRSQSCIAHAPSHRSQSSCSLHSLHSDCHERSLCEHARTWSTHSVPNFCGGSCGSVMSPFACPLSQRFAYGSLHRSCSGCMLPMTAPPSTTEMQLRRVLHDIRSSLQNLSQHPGMRGNDRESQRSSVLPLYENTFQELQIMRRSLNLFRTQMMDLELNMLRQQTMVYQHLTEEERYEADQLQGLRNSVRMELQELELQLDERLLVLEEQLRNFHASSPFQRPSAMGMFGGRSTDSLLYSTPLNVIEPVTELIREQTHLKSELGLEDLGVDAEHCESLFSHGASDSSSVSSSPRHKVKKSLINSDPIDKPKPQTHTSKTVYRASVALTPSPPMRSSESQNLKNVETPEDPEKSKMGSAEKHQPLPSVSEKDGSPRWTAEENEELQQVIREIKESIVGDIRREIVSGLLAAVSSPTRSFDGKK